LFSAKYHVGTQNSCYLRTYFLLVPHDVSKPKVFNTVIQLVYHVSDMFWQQTWLADGTKKRWSRLFVYTIVLLFLPRSLNIYFSIRNLNLIWNTKYTLSTEFVLEQVRGNNHWRTSQVRLKVLNYRRLIVREYYHWHCIYYGIVREYYHWHCVGFFLFKNKIWTKLYCILPRTIKPRTDDIRLVGTTCCESVGLINPVTRWQQLVLDLSTGNKQCAHIFLTSCENFLYFFAFVFHGSTIFNSLYLRSSFSLILLLH
jgi:hypothetical protein